VIAERFTDAAALPTQAAGDLGGLGHVARGSGLNIGARRQHPLCDLGPACTVATRGSRDVLARFVICAEEIIAFVALLADLFATATTGRGSGEAPANRPDTAASGVGIADGWRGAITGRVELAADGTLTRSRSSGCPSSAGRRGRSPWPARSSRTSRWSTRASTSPTPARTCDRMPAASSPGGVA